MAWTTPRTWTSGELVTALMMNQHVRDNMNAILGGLVGTGFTEFDVLGTAVAPSVSTAGHATLYYSTALAGLYVSKNGGAYESIGGSGGAPWADPTIISRWRDIVRA